MMRYMLAAALLFCACGKKEEAKTQAAAPAAAPALKPGEKEVGSGKIGNAMDMTQYAGMVEQAKKTADAANAVQAQKQDVENQADQAH